MSVWTTTAVRDSDVRGVSAGQPLTCAYRKTVEREARLVCLVSLPVENEGVAGFRDPKWFDNQLPVIIEDLGML